MDYSFLKSPLTSRAVTCHNGTINRLESLLHNRKMVVRFQTKIRGNRNIYNMAVTLLALRASAEGCVKRLSPAPIRAVVFIKIRKKPKRFKLEP